MNSLDVIIRANKFFFFKVATFKYSSRIPKRWTCTRNFASSANCNSLGVRHFRTGVQDTSKDYKEQNYFELLGCNASFDIDEKELERKFRATLSQWHPDLHSQSSSQLQEQAAAVSASVNRAYSVLKKPHLRAKYLLELKGVPLSEDDTAMDPSFLMYVMELREKVEEETDRVQLQRIRESVLKETKLCLENLSKAFQKESMEDAKTETQKLQYYERLREALVEKLD